MQEIIQYNRPKNPVEFKDIEHILTLNGKDILRLASKSLSMRGCGHYTKGMTSCYRGIFGHSSCNQIISTKNLINWLESFFNLKKGSEQGLKCINHMNNLGILVTQRCLQSSGIFSNDYYRKQSGIVFPI